MIILQMYDFLRNRQRFFSKNSSRQRVVCHGAVVERTNIAKEKAPLAMFALLETVPVMQREQMNFVLLYNHFMSIDDVDALLHRFATKPTTIDGKPCLSIVHCPL